MPILAIVVLVLSAAVSGCNRPAHDAEPATAGSAALAPAPGASPSTAAAAPELAVADQDRHPAPAPGPAGEAALAGSDPQARGSHAAAPSFTEVTLPAGTLLPLVLDTAVASDSSRVEEAVHAHLARPVRAGGVVALPAGSAVNGVVTTVVRSGKVKGRAHVAMQFGSVTPAGGDERYTMATARVGRTAPATKKDDTLKVVAPAAGGAIIGRIAGGRKGAAIGTAVGAGAGGAVVMSTRGKEVRLARGATLSIRLSEPLTIRVPKG